MTFPPSFRSLAFALAVAVAGAAVAAPARAASLPRLEADALGGDHVVLPDAGGGKPFVILLAFTPESENDLKAWSRELLRRNTAPVYVVVVADKQALMSRKHIRSIVEGAAVGTKEQIDSHVLITFTGAGWQTLTPPGDKRTAGVVVCDAGGNVAYAQRAAFNPEHLADVEHALR